MKKATFHPAATAEAAEAAEFYNSQQHDLGHRFLFAVEEAVARARVNPLLFPMIEGDVRRCLVNTFPFGIIFIVNKSRVLVLAVMHLRRQPGYWKDRM